MNKIEIPPAVLAVIGVLALAGLVFVALNFFNAPSGGATPQDMADMEKYRLESAGRTDPQTAQNQGGQPGLNAEQQARGAQGN